MSFILYSSEKKHLFSMFNIIVEEEKKNTEKFILSHDL